MDFMKVSTCIFTKNIFLVGFAHKALISNISDSNVEYRFWVGSFRLLPIYGYQ